MFRAIATAATVILLAKFVNGEYYLCNVCQNSNYGERYLYDRSESFINPSTNERWTCGELQDAVQDVDPTSNGAAGEAYLCTGKERKDVVSDSDSLNCSLRNSLSCVTSETTLTIFSVSNTRRDALYMYGT
jgi:hypothetical protein